MKKLLSIVLATAMLICSLSVAASAKVYDYEISLGQTLEVAVSPVTERTVKFAPEHDSVFILEAESEDLDTYCWLFAAETDEELQISDDENGSDFRLEYEFEAGKTYYFCVGVYGDEDAPVSKYKITLLCGHSFDGDTCSVCGEVCEHDTVGFLGFCLCGANYIGNELAVGAQVKYDKSKTEMWFRFVPEETGLYLLESASADELSDPDAELYNAEGEWLYGDYDSVGVDFALYYILEAGETYYYNVYPYYCELDTDIKFSRVTHTTDDGAVHTDLDFEEETWSNCTEHGYTEGVYCNTCEEFISGHEQLELDKEWHIDDDWDDICDLCGEKLVCDHICHSDNWFLSFIWTIANFIHSLLGISPECECGAYHYYSEEIYY